MGKEIKELECVFGYIGNRRRRQTAINMQIHWHDTDSDYQMCCPQLSAIHGKDCRRTCVGRSRHGVESCAVTKRRPKRPFERISYPVFPRWCYTPTNALYSAIGSLRQGVFGMKAIENDAPKPASQFKTLEMLDVHQIFRWLSAITCSR